MRKAMPMVVKPLSLLLMLEVSPVVVFRVAGVIVDRTRRLSIRTLSKSVSSMNSTED